MTNIERRSLLGATGAMLALAACKKDQKVEATIFAPCPNFGDSPKKSDNTKPGAKIGWRPLHYCVVYINMDDSKLVARHAYYPTGLTSDQQDRDNPLRKTEALSGLQEMAQNGIWPGTPLFPGSDFKDFWFGSQQEIYILVDGKLAQIDGHNLLVFAERPTKASNPEKPKPNDTFYNAHVLPETINNKEVLFLQNWFVEDKKKETTIKKSSKPWDHKKRPEKVYAMNIHVLLGAAGIPGVIDPDTGNGSGNEP